MQLTPPTVGSIPRGTSTNRAQTLTNGAVIRRLPLRKASFGRLSHGRQESGQPLPGLRGEPRAVPSRPDDATDSTGAVAPAGCGSPTDGSGSSVELCHCSADVRHFSANLPDCSAGVRDSSPGLRESSPEAPDSFPEGPDSFPEVPDSSREARPRLPDGRRPAKRRLGSPKFHFTGHI